MSDWISEFDRYLWGKGTFYKSYKKFGAHSVSSETDLEGFYFCVWAPNADYVSVIGDFNFWNRGAHQMSCLENSGIWCAKIPEARSGQAYKFYIENNKTGFKGEKADPYAFFSETAPKTASRLYFQQNFNWEDQEWLKKRVDNLHKEKPMSIYEIHLPSWKKVPDEMNRSLSFYELSLVLPDYVKDLGFTHVEFLPPFEHPFEGSWGYQVTGYYAPLSRLGTPDEFKQLVNAFHKQGIGVIIDWVPAHFPSDAHALSKFDGTFLYEHEDIRKGFHPDWNTLIFNYGRFEVSNFLISNALYWCDYFHIDGFRVDAVASMLYLDYSRKAGEWIPNIYGGKENLEAIEFLKHFNSQIKFQNPGVITIAEESTAWPDITKSVDHGGLGFDYKWNMGWMHDSLSYFQKDPLYRSYHHDQVTFGIMYAFSENFVLPFSHDEVVHEKKSLCEKMPGDDFQKFSHLRALLSFQYFYPGKKLLFMGTEFAQRSEWSHDRSLDWYLESDPSHSGIKQMIKDLNTLYQNHNPLYENDHSYNSFEWVVCDDNNQSVFAFYRISVDSKILVVLNATPVGRNDYRIGVKYADRYKEIFNSNSIWYGGEGSGNLGELKVETAPSHGMNHSIVAYLPPMSLIALENADCKQ